MEMAVTNLGKTDFFLGLDWLHYHNPNINWEQSTLTFDRANAWQACGGTCRQRE